MADTPVRVKAQRQNASLPGVVRLVKPEDRRRLAALVHLEPFVHQHPGWYAPLERLGEPGFVALEAADAPRLHATAALFRETDEVAWVRLFASEAAMSSTAWPMLFAAALKEITSPKLKWVAAMPFADWFRRLLEASGFYFFEDVRMLVWERQPLPPVVPTEGFRLRPMRETDLREIAAVDAAAFGAFWRMSAKNCRTALFRSVWATVVEDLTTRRIAGFQVSTPSPLGGHMARLAVSPAYQGRGLGRWLVADALAFFERNRAESVTLNTQGNNARALALYRALGFHTTGETYSVYRYDVAS